MAANPKIPKTVTILGYEFKIILSDESAFRFRRKVIEIDKTAEDLESELLHEICHGIFYISGHAFEWEESGEENRGKEEALVRSLENGLAPLYGLKKNKNVKY